MNHSDASQCKNGHFVNIHVWEEGSNLPSITHQTLCESEEGRWPRYLVGYISAAAI